MTEGYYEPCATYAPSDVVVASSSHQRIHAPIPISSYSTLLPHLAHDFSDTHSTSRTAQFAPSPYHRFPPADDLPSPSLPSTSRSRSSSLTSEQSYQMPSPELGGMNDSTSLDEFRNVSHTTFPTPCELLVKLSEPDCLPSRTRQQSLPLPTPAQTRSLPIGKPPPGNAKACQPRGGKTRSSTSAANVKSPFVTNKLPHSPSSTTTSPSTSRHVRPENIRKSYFRTVQDYVGFKLTDPDTITSHEKKRHSLEALEQYVVWLHEQISVVGHTPLPVERVDKYERGLNSRSIRTMLVHYQDITKRAYRDLKQKDPEFPMFDEVVV
ncbi:hypothetical protein BC629DRAFT_1588811 [Irpex lacteus]|nr:hypothetical protein BC629DRAFT_1588811 [Irpex lacteus]